MHSIDVLTRILADGLAKTADARFFVENRPGASGAVAVRESIASADGPTLPSRRGLASSGPRGWRARRCAPSLLVAT